MSYQEISCSEPKARKEHRCEWCNEKICVGEKHFQRTYVFEGDFNNGRMHLECKAAMEKTPHDELIDGWMPGDFKRGKMATNKKVIDLETYKLEKNLDKMGEFITDLEIIADQAAANNDHKTLQEIIELLRPITALMEKEFENERKT